MVIETAPTDVLLPHEHNVASRALLQLAHGVFRGVEAPLECPIKQSAPHSTYKHADIPHVLRGHVYILHLLQQETERRTPKASLRHACERAGAWNVFVCDMIRHIDRVPAGSGICVISGWGYALYI